MPACAPLAQAGSAKPQFTPYPQESRRLQCISTVGIPKFHMGVRGLPERDILSLGAMGRGVGGLRKFSVVVVAIAVAAAVHPQNRGYRIFKKMQNHKNGFSEIRTRETSFYNISLI